MDHNRLRHNKYLPMTRQWSPNYLRPPSQYVLKDPRSSLQSRTNDPPAFELYIDQTWWRLSPVSSLITVDLYISGHLYRPDHYFIKLICARSLSNVNVSSPCNPSLYSHQALAWLRPWQGLHLDSRSTLTPAINNLILLSLSSRFSLCFLVLKTVWGKVNSHFPTKIPLKRSSGGYFSALTALTTQVSCYPN